MEAMEVSLGQVRIETRETLLDAVDSLGPHSDAVILAGARRFIYTPPMRMPASLFPHSHLTQTSCSIPRCWKTARRSWTR